MRLHDTARHIPPELNRVRVSEHFELSEFQCPHCGTVRVVPKLLAVLEALRAKVGRPLIVTSGYRCAEYHATIPGAAPGSRHLYGDGVDLRLVPGVSVDQLADMARAAGATGIGLYDDHLHVDVRPGAPAFWDRRKPT